MNRARNWGRKLKVVTIQCESWEVSFTQYNLNSPNAQLTWNFANSDLMKKIQINKERVYLQLGLVRHFKVKDQKPTGWVTADQFAHWVKHYDEAPIEPIEIMDGEMDWELCFTSDLPRAVHTAKSLCKCEIIETPLLREIPLTAFSKKLKLPLALWSLAGRLAWSYSHSSQEETRRETVARAEEFIELLKSTQKNKVLIVSHGFFLMELSKLLGKAGYSGKRKWHYKNGELLLFKNDA